MLRRKPTKIELKPEDKEEVCSVHTNDPLSRIHSSRSMYYKPSFICSYFVWNWHLGKLRKASIPWSQREKRWRTTFILWSSCCPFPCKNNAKLQYCTMPTPHQIWDIEWNAEPLPRTEEGFKLRSTWQADSNGGKTLLTKCFYSLH